MKTNTIRKTKGRLINLLAKGPPGLDDLTDLGPARMVVNPLFGALYHGSPIIKWRAVQAMGLVTAHLAETDLEAARIIMRRLMWNLNDESGGIGWGSPEAMGEITAICRQLAEEFGCILVSYINPEGNFLEHPVLQRGSLWGLGRLLNRRPAFAAETADHLPFFLQSRDPHLRALAAWVACPLQSAPLSGLLAQLLTDQKRVEIFLEERLQLVTVGQMAASALARYRNKA